MAALATILRRLCFIDIETTGLDPSRDEVIEIGAVFVEQGEITSRRGWLIKPHRSVPPFITALTGLADEDLATAPHFSAVEAELSAALNGWTLVAHNASFERAFLGEAIASNAMLDSCEVAQILFPERSSHSLDALVRWLKLGRAARHRALEDAEDTFFVLAALCRRILAEGGPSRLGRLISFLEQAGDPPSDLCRLLCALHEASDANQPPPVRSPTPLSPAGMKMAQQLAGWLRAPTFFAAELERAELLPLALHGAQSAAQVSGKRIAIAVCASTFRELEDSTGALALARRPVCSTQLRAALESRTGRPHERFALAYLWSWLERTCSGDVDGISRSVRAKCPEVAGLLVEAPAEPCADATCFAHRAPQPERCVLITHQHALDWLERGVRSPVVFLEAEQLPEAELRRGQQSLEWARLERFGGLEPDLSELRGALAAFPPGVVLLRARLNRPWLSIREAMTKLSHRLRSAPLSQERSALLARIVDVLEPPPLGFEVLVSPAGLTRQLSHPGRQIARRLAGGHCLISSYQGGLKWAQAAPVAAPTLESGWQLEWRAEPTSVERLAQLVARTAPVTLVTRSPFGPIVEACRAQGLSVSLSATRGASVQLCEWHHDRPMPQNPTCVFYDVREWRRAVLTSRASRVMLLSPSGLQAEPIERALRGLHPRPLAAGDAS